MYEGAAVHGDARLVAKAYAHASSAAASGKAFDTAGASAPIAKARSAIFLWFMVVFLDGQKYQRPSDTLGDTNGPHK